MEHGWHLSVDGDRHFFKAEFSTVDELIEHVGRLLYGNPLFSDPGIVAISFGPADIIEMEQWCATPEGYEWTMLIADRTPPRTVNFKTKHDLFGFLLHELRRGVRELHFSRRFIRE